jgi:hypothetical protein
MVVCYWNSEMPGVEHYGIIAYSWFPLVADRLGEGVRPNESEWIVPGTITE